MAQDWERNPKGDQTDLIVFEIGILHRGLSIKPELCPEVRRRRTGEAKGALAELHFLVFGQGEGDALTLH
jgi:hypothetical protein